MATAQSPIFRLLRIYYFPTANIPIISLQQIEQLFQHCKSSKYLITVNRNILWQLQIAYFEIFRRFKWQLRKAKFCGHYTSIILLLRISQFFMYCKSTNYFTTGNRLHNCLLCIEKFYDNFKSPISKHNDLYGYCAKPNFLATEHYTIIFLLHISQLFIYCKSTNYFATGNRLSIWLLCTEELYDKFKLPIWKYFDDLYGFCAKPNFLAAAHHTIIFPLHISQLFVYWKSTNYFTTGNRLNIW